MLVKKESILVSVADPVAVSPKLQGLNEEYERKNALGSKYSSPDLKEFQPLLSNEDRGTTKAAPRTNNSQRVQPGRLSSGFGEEVEAAQSSRRLPDWTTNGVATSPELFGEDDDLEFGRTDTAKGSLVGDSEGRLFLECNQVNRCKASAQCWREEDFFDHSSAASQRERERCATRTVCNDGVQRRRLNTWAPNASSAKRAAGLCRTKPRAARQSTRTKSEVEFSPFSDIFPAETTPPKCSPEARSSSSELAPQGKPGYNARSRRESERERRVAEWTREECARNGDSSRVAKKDRPRQLVGELRVDKEHFRDEQSKKSFVLLVDQLADVRVRNRFVRQDAGKRRMAVCEELERVTVGNAIGEYLLELRKQLNVIQVLNHMF